MDSNLIILSSLAMDLKRVALGLHRRSYGMAERFSEEVKKRNHEVRLDTVKPYMRKVLAKISGVLLETDKNRKAEDCLMYSTLLQNYVVKFS